MIGLPEKLSVEITTKCNLHCEICPKQSPNYHHPDSEMDFETFSRLKPLFPYIKSLILNGIGEPLLHPNIENFIALASAYMPEGALIGFQTNGVLLTDEKLKELVKAGLNKICVSIDSLTPVNGLHEPEYGEKALETIYRIKLNNNGKLQSGIETVITRDNLDQIVPTIKEASKYGIDFIILSHLIPYSPLVLNKVAYETNNEESVKIFKKWLTLLEKAGYTINEWLELMKKKALPEFFPEENEAMRLFKGMYDEATEKGLTLHMQNLINRDEKLIKEVNLVLKEVKRLSKKLDISIQIPKTNPAPRRKCDFLEEKCLFIGVDGEVSPCYFLWHSFTCYIAGLKKSVKRWTFGNIKDKDPGYILNSSEYTNFINSVLKYDFPYCYDCNFALCDLMELEDFLYDCYTNDVPCGACLWCGGLFYCMI
ncbi:MULTISPECIES: radical SAM/SPASM family putative metalloenzyme maturase [Thermodesulfovibrio]|uniref:Radical SAM domain protein, putative n=2 Tax=Thermodesulfovibrio yellowstonii TaxID=28262 RepID=B5YHE0_THEYD|nr:MULTISPECIES: radical SAM/SPASM family putative metalloenzyme maturase [Thermodesulfovibrio]ACI20549.1 radical SAM domain protein, putative [Thermodesulfovibrio yellowstonii DSM 11347]MDI6865450.1 radical SAM/SPASM family putative metalloenzyme maturase [Thermodesulfovibrio yellowstonii]GLI52646.1 radical SAM protein [Thermodesulfovibrio islandicus]